VRAAQAILRVRELAGDEALDAVGGGGADDAAHAFDFSFASSLWLCDTWQRARCGLASAAQTA
jgi:hypothetical protein